MTVTTVCPSVHDTVWVFAGHTVRCPGCGTEVPYSRVTGRMALHGTWVDPTRDVDTGNDAA